uniref:Integrase catalytic domain-containing protein n=1 Tax=Magallana gigas TaxID=29159 RepID=A0A8W8MZ15_MAGGI
MVCSVEDFLKSPDASRLQHLTKDELFLFVTKFGLNVKRSSRKAEIRNVVVQYLVEEGILESSAMSLVVEVEKPVKKDYEFELQFKQLEIEQERERRAYEREKFEQERLIREQERLAREQEREYEKERSEREHEHALTMKQLEFDTQRLKREEAEANARSKPDFDVAKNIRLVPKFQEKDVDKYFIHFEKVAQNLNWPKEIWPLLLQSTFIGKAREIYGALSLHQSSDYDIIKENVLKAYELVPEAYRQKFRNYKKFNEQTHVEFSREKQNLFERWCSSKHVGSNFEKLKQIILIEEFKNCIHPEIRTYLDEQKVENLEQAATAADDYALTHKGSFTKQRNSNNDNSRGRPDNSQVTLGSKSTSSEQVKVTDKNDMTTKSGPICNYCKRKGHIKSECWALQRKKFNSDNPSPSALTSVQGKFVCSKFENPQVKSESDILREEFIPFVFDGFVSLDGTDLHPIKILRDTGASQSLFLEGVLPLSEKSYTGSDVLIQGVELGFVKVPLHEIGLRSDLVSGNVVVGVRPTLPVKGVSLLLGNDLAGGKVVPDPVVCNRPSIIGEEDNKELFPSCAVTRAMAKKLRDPDLKISREGLDKGNDLNIGLNETFMSNLLKSESHTSSENQHQHASKDDVLGLHEMFDKTPLTRDRLISEQESDLETKGLSTQVLSPEEAEKVPICYYKNQGVLMRKWRPRDAPVDHEWQVHHQIVVPRAYRQTVIGLAHDTPMSGHLGIKKTYCRVLAHFFWPKMRKDVVEYCRSCHVCQVVGKPNQKIPPAPLIPIPAFDEPFTKVIIDCVGPLPKTKVGNQYLLTIMCASTRFPEAIPLRNIKSRTIVNALTKFFTNVGLPLSVQSDQGSNFTSKVFKQVMCELGIKHHTSSAYHPESQGALERFHQTLKTMMRTYCLSNEKDWDQGIPYLLFAVRDAKQESLGFSPFELVYGHTVRGPLKLLKEKWLGPETETSLLDYVSKFKERISQAWTMARENLKVSQTKMKTWYDKHSKSRVFKSGDKVLVLLPIPGQPLRAKYFGPFEVEQKVNDVNYIIKTPGRRKSKQLCHINMIKQYHDRQDPHYCKSEQVVASNSSITYTTNQNWCHDQSTPKLKNSDILANLKLKLAHLDDTERLKLTNLIQEFSDLFPDVPQKTNLRATGCVVSSARLERRQGSVRKDVEESSVIRPCRAGSRYNCDCWTVF